MQKTADEKESTNRHLKLKLLNSGLLIVSFDSPQKINQLTSAVMSEFEIVLDRIESDPAIKAVGVISAKPDSFLLGADLREIMQLKSHEAATNLVNRGHACFARLAAIKKPTVAAIHGICLGGGLELALCCHKRIATDNIKTLIGLPETKLGFVPGLGGTQRLPRLVGLKNAMDLILSAEPVSAKRALEIKVIDKIVDEDKLYSEMEKIAQEMMLDANTLSVDDFYNEKYTVLTPADQSVLKTARRSMRMITRGNYPALLRVVDVIECGLVNGLTAGLVEEAKVFAELSISDVSRNLVSLFFNSELVKQSALGAAQKENALPIKSIGIIGGGMMGRGLAKYLAEKGCQILFRSADKKRTEVAFAELEEELQKNMARRYEDLSVSQFNLPVVALNIQAVYDDQAFSEVDMIIEATEEILSTKIALFKHLETIIKSDCLLSTITSSLAVTSIANELKEQTLLIGAHFFHPVDKMPLVEVALPAAEFINDRKVEAKYKQANARLLTFLADLGKTPISVKDSPNFLVNRLLAVYLLEAGRLAQVGVPLSWIDKTALEFGMPMGPLTLLDEVGLDIALLVARSLANQSPERVVLPAVLSKVEALGMKGKRFGSGIYIWDANGKRLGVNPKLLGEFGLKDSDESVDEIEKSKISHALILPMIDEAARCLEEKVVRRAREVDIGCVLGLGFPPFRGGILKYADSLSLPVVVEKLNEIYAQSVPRRQVSNMLADLALKNSTFY